MRSLLVTWALAAEPVSATAAVGRPWWDDPSPHARGDLSADELRSGLEAVSGKLQICFTALRTHQPDAAGPATLAFTVGPDGVPRDVAARASALGADWFPGCAERSVAQARFPARSASTRVRWVVRFGPETLEGAPARSGLDVGSTRVSGWGPGLGDPERREEARRAFSVQVDNAVLIEGPLDPALVDPVIRRRMNEIRYCYQRTLDARPPPAGEITARFRVQADGTVSRAETAATTLGDPEIEGCVRDRLIRMRFPATDGGGHSTLTARFTFAPE